VEKNLQNTTEKVRKPYQKPTLERVRLVAEEAVLAGCKLAIGGVSPGVTGTCINISACLLLTS